MARIAHLLYRRLTASTSAVWKSAKQQVENLSQKNRRSLNYFVVHCIILPDFEKKRKPTEGF